MSGLIDLNPNHLATVKAILAEHVPDCEVRAFGSRATWTAKDYSDLDLAVVGKGPLDWGTLGRLQEAFEESDLPMRVDVLDWHSITESFRKVIEQDYAVLQGGVSGGAVQQGEWREMPFSDAVLVNPPTGLDRGETYPFVDMAAVNADSRSVYPSDRREFRGGGSRFQSGDTLMARITPCLENGKIARYHAPDSVSEAHGSTEFIVIRGRPGLTENDFAYYLTNWDEVCGYAIDQMTGTSGRQRVPVASLDHLTVPIPSLPEQRAIAHVLGTLDDKIELNRRMNETLEAMARALFKSWFVDFDPVRAKIEGRWRRGESLPGLPADLYHLFPNRLVPSELGEIPEGWEIRELGDVAIQRRAGVKPDQIDPATPYIALEHIPRRCIALEYWDSADGLASGKFRFRHGDILFGKLRPYFHKVGVAPVDGVCSTDIVVLTPISSQWFGFVLGHASSKEFVDYTDAASTGTRMPRTKWDDMARYKVALPSSQAARAFNDMVRPWIDSMISTIHRSRALAAQRDALLPRLVSGDIKVQSD